VTVPALVDHLFRHEAARMTATLARILGPGHIELVEDVVQEALLAALARWPRDGIPANPTAWLVQVAKHRALDVLRRERLAVDRDTAIREEIARWSDRDDMAIADDPVLLDDQLRMIFICCHPAIPAETRVTLTLKLAGGFGAPEIARALVAEETAIHQRLVRAKRRIRDAGFAFEMPEVASRSVSTRCSTCSTRCSRKGTRHMPATHCSAATSARRRCVWELSCFGTRRWLGPRCMRSWRSFICMPLASRRARMAAATCCCWPTRTAHDGMRGTSPRV
jgi:RNA polymerase sigma factor (sigma-70 family)